MESLKHSCDLGIVFLNLEKKLNSCQVPEDMKTLKFGFRFLMTKPVLKTT